MLVCTKVLKRAGLRGIAYNLEEALAACSSSPPLGQGCHSSSLLYVRCMHISVPRGRSSLLGQAQAQHTFTRMSELEGKQTHFRMMAVFSCQCVGLLTPALKSYFLSLLKDHGLLTWYVGSVWMVLRDP